MPDRLAQMGLLLIAQIENYLMEGDFELWDTGPLVVEHITGEPYYHCRLTFEFKGERKGKEKPHD